MNITQYRVRQLFGDKCACCGSQESPQLDHKEPIRPQDKKHVMGKSYQLTRIRLGKWVDALKHPEKYQLLCADCNRWKDNGPCCPCKYWDSIAPGWRLRAAGLAENEPSDPTENRAN